MAEQDEPRKVKRPMALPSDEHLAEDAKVDDEAVDDGREFWRERSPAKWAALPDATKADEDVRSS